MANESELFLLLLIIIGMMVTHVILAISGSGPNDRNK
jgi:hypothetical protein